MPASAAARRLHGRAMVDRLSLMQFRRLGDLPRARGRGPVAEFLHRVRALGDPEVLSVSASCGGRVRGAAAGRLNSQPDRIILRFPLCSDLCSTRAMTQKAPPAPANRRPPRRISIRFRPRPHGRLDARAAGRVHRARFAESRCVLEACRRVGMSSESAYELSRRPDAPSFRRAWHAARAGAGPPPASVDFPPAVNFGAGASAAALPFIGRRPLARAENAPPPASCISVNFLDVADFRAGTNGTLSGLSQGSSTSARTINFRCARRRAERPLGR